MKNKRVNRLFKDRLFRMAFKEKKYLLELYNAMNGSHYTDPDGLIITTLEDVVYLGMKNDASFLLNDVLSLWEHQSTFNPNMPVRGLAYFAKLYQQYIDSHGLNIYGSTLQKLPFPQYVVFYNGALEEPDRKELWLSDAFIRRAEHLHGVIPAVEVRAVMLNVNWGRNKELMEECKRLKEYSQFVERMRRYKEEYHNLEDAVERAVEESIEDGILADILVKQRTEVIELFLTDYDEKKQRRLERRDAKKEERELVNRLNLALAEQGRTEDIIRAASDEAYQNQLIEEVLGEKTDDSDNEWI